ncbi:MAG: flagellar filament capping protein FliD [Anaerolineae bacterium]|nr:flagellar filament capping protein FliD [Anaerolineae bacterium]
MVSATGDFGYLSTSAIESLVAASMQYRQRLVTRIKDDVSQLQVLKGILTDLTAKLSSLNGVAKQLAGFDSTYTFGSAQKVEPGTSGVITASASSAASAGDYSIEVTSLAKAHTIIGRRYGQVDQALGLSGTFYLGGKAASEAAATVINSGVTGFGTGEVAGGQTQLGSGDYYVEFRQSGENWQFRLVDAGGTPVSIGKADGTEGATAAWQPFADVAGSTFDTGRGLTITFGAEPDGARFIGDAGTARVAYSAQGAAISVVATDSLADIKAAINAASYAPGNTITASIVDNQLVLTAAETGAAHAIAGEDTIGSVLQDLELMDAAGNALHQVQAASDACLTINGSIVVTRSRNSSLTDVISGLTLSLVGEGTTTLKVSTDLSAAQNKVSDFVSKFNDAMTYLRAKTALTPSTSTAYGSNPTYTRGALAGDSTFTMLKSRLYQTITARYEGGSLQDLGMAVNGSTMSLEVQDSSKLASALATDFEGTAALLAEVAAALYGVVEPYVGSTTDGILARRSTSVEGEMKAYNKRAAEMSASIEREAQRMREQYYRLQQQYVAALQRQQEWLLFGGSTLWG